MFSPNQVCVSDASKGKNSNRQSKERVADGEGANREDGGPRGASASACSLDQFKGFESLGEQVCGNTGEQGLGGRPWNLAISGKGTPTPGLVDRGPLASEKVLVFKFRLCPCPLICVCARHLSVHLSVCVCWGDFSSGCS